MGDENILNGFMEGFAKAAEDAGFHGEDVRKLMQLSVDLAQSVKHPDAFSAGFDSVMVGG